MPSFRTIFVLATAALAGLVSAAPTLPSTPPSVPAAPSSPLPAARDVQARCDCSTIPNILVDVKAQISVISAHLNAAVSGAATVDVAVVTPCLNDIKTVLIAATAQVKVLQAQDDVSVDEALTAQGKILTVQECAELLLTVFASITTVLSVAVKAVVNGQVSVCLGIVAEVGVCVAELLTAIFSIVAGLQLEFCGLLGPLVAVIGELKLSAVVALLLKVHVAAVIV